MGEIMLNRMYAGSYLDNEGYANIGHEIINLFRADNGCNYIYAQPYGTCGKEHDGKIETVVLVKWAGNKTMEILAKAEELEQIIAFGAVKDEKAVNARQKTYIDQENITYGGIKLYEIFQNNLRNEIAKYITFKANRVLLPRKPILITTDEKMLEKPADGVYVLEDISFSTQSLKMYISDEKHESAYQTLRSLLDNPELWEERNSTRKIDVASLRRSPEEEDFNFLRLIKKEYDELSFSNLFAHYFSRYPAVFQAFSKEVLGVEIDFPFSVIREEHHIDLLIRDTANTIIIENKIKSGINGVKHDVTGEYVKSQLDDYYAYAKKDETRKVSAFIFSPNYNRINPKDLSDEIKEKYKIIQYGKIYDFFESKMDTFAGDRYFPDFLCALKKHIREYDDNHYEEMRQRFINAILANGGVVPD